MVAIMRRQEQMMIQSVGCSMLKQGGESGGIQSYYERRVNKSYSPVCGLMLNQNSTDSSTNTHKSAGYTPGLTPFTTSSAAPKGKIKDLNPEDSDRVL